MKRKLFVVLLSVFWLAFYGIAFAGSSSIQVGVGIHYLDYKEDLPAPLKSTEIGWLPSVYVGYEYRKPSKINIKLFGDYAAGNVTYDGTTQGGTPITFSDNKQIFFRFEGDIGYTFEVRKDFQLIPYVGYGYRFWSRGEGKITSAYISYKEEYSWNYIPLGVRADYRINNQWNIGGALAAHYMFSGKMKAFFSEVMAGTGDVEFDLGNETGLYADLPLSYRFAGDWSAALTPWYEYSAIGKSNIVNVTSNNTVIGYSYEPASRTHQYGLRFGVSRSF